MRRSAQTDAFAGHRAQPPAALPPWPAARVAYYTLFVLVLCLTSSQLDVYIVPYLAGSIKADLHLTDTDLALLIGASFGLFYTLVGLPIAWFVDRFSRRWIIALGIAIWNIGTALCGVAQNFTQLFAARFLVGAGEAVNGPASYSMIADLYPRERMPRAVALLQLGSVVGPALALLLGALLLHRFLGMRPIAVPFGVIHGWQLIFVLIGVPGALISVLILMTVPEPARRRIPHQIEGEVRRTDAGLLAWLSDYRAALAYMLRHRMIYGPMFASLFFGSFAIGAQQWGPIFYQRTFGWSPARLAELQGLAQLTVVPLGLAASVLLAERFSRERREDSAMRVYIVSRLLGLPAVAYVLMPTPWLAFGLSLFSSFTLGMAGTAQNAALQIITPAELRGKITALYLFVYAVFGLALSPLVPALIGDFVLHSEAMIRWGIFWPLAIFNPLALAVAALALRPYGREVARLTALER